MRQAWRWASKRPEIAAAVAGAFLVGLLLGAVLGWAGLGQGTVDWGTAGEWVPGILSGAATAGALLWAVRAFLVERRDREMMHAVPVTVTVYVAEWPGGRDLCRVYCGLANYGSAAVTDSVVYAQIDGRIEWKRCYELSPHDRRKEFIDFHELPAPDSPTAHKPRVWLVFRDVAQQWWSRAEGEPPVLLRRPPDEVLSEHASSRGAREAKKEASSDDAG